MPATQLNLFDRPATRGIGSADQPLELKEIHQELTVEERGAVFTRPEVVTFMLDLAGYRVDDDLPRRRVLEPSAGDGAFAAQIADRLIRSFLARGGQPAEAYAALHDRFTAVEVFAASAEQLRTRLCSVAQAAGLHSREAEQLAQAWVSVGDFLLADFAGSFDLIVGNPPYVRQENIPAPLLQHYRERYSTLFNRADLYVLFFERGLSLLRSGGKLVYICSDRWMKCAYGRPLRALVAQEHNLDVFVDMVDTPAFTSEVSAYPAITVISRTRPARPVTLAAFRPSLSPEKLEALAAGFSTGRPDDHLGIGRLASVAAGSAPWLLAADDDLQVVRGLEEHFPVLEAAGCKVGIGVATGCDRVFVGDYEALDVEPSRKLRIVMADCIRSGRLVWGGKGVVNPFEPDGSLADLKAYPRFAAYLLRHEVALRGRNVARRSGEGWYRTIDRIWDHLPARPKLLIPDIKGEPNVVIDRGEFYPHHNLYWITSDEWGLEELQAVLRSTLARFFVATYCVKMANGFLRFQAQYLRRIRIPAWSTVSPIHRQALRAAVAQLDQAAIDAAVYAAYGLGTDAIALLNRYREGTRARTPCH